MLSIISAREFLTAVGLWLNVDGSIARWFHARVNPSFSDWMLVLSGLGSELCVGSLIIAAGIFLAWKRYWPALLTLLLIAPCGALLGELLKVIVQRTRPFMDGPMGPWGGYSFPSGHTLGATLIYGFLAVLLTRAAKPGPWRLWPCYGAAVVVLGVGFSRIALGAHYLSDVLAGMLLGLSWLMLCLLLAEMVRRMRLRAATVVATRAPDELLARDGQGDGEGAELAA